MSDCQADCLRIHHAVMKHYVQDPTGLDVTWDTHRAVQYTRVKSLDNVGLMDCMLTSHLNWSFLRGRPVSGYEQMLIQGSDGSAGPARASFHLHCGREWFCRGVACNEQCLCQSLASRFLMPACNVQDIPTDTVTFV
jgi:hypothetical protein